MAMETGRGGGVRRPLSQLFAIIKPYTEEWADERETSEPPQVGPSLLVVEGFDDLAARLRWLERKARSDFGLDASGFEAVIALSGMLDAAGRSGVRVGIAPPDPIVEEFLALWTPGLDCGADVTPPQVAAAYFTGGWAPPGGSRWDHPRWEPASLAILAVTFKAVRAGLHSLAARGVPPLLRERCEQRATFEQRALAIMQEIALELTVTPPQSRGCAPFLASWNCQESSLWGFVFDATLGPGRPGGGGDRPLAGAFAKSLLGLRCERTMGITVKTVEEYVCTSCKEAHPDPKCPIAPYALVMATSRRNRLVTPKARLQGDDRSWGHEEVRRTICKNPTCLRELRCLLEACGRAPCVDQQPLYDSRLARCPYCGDRPSRWHKTVWTRHP